MNAIEMVEKMIRDSLPSAWTRIRRPRSPDGEWWLDVKQDDHVVAIQWSSRRGFGITASAFGDAYGEGPEEIFVERQQATGRILELLRTRQHTIPPKSVLLQELRGFAGITQEMLADKLGIKQAAVSRLERREDITLGSLKRYVAAIGAELDISVRTATGEHLRLAGASIPKEERATPDDHSSADTGLASYLKGSHDKKPRMSLLVIRTADLERSRTFYSALGLTFNSEKHGAGPLHYSCTMNNVVVEIYPTKNGSTGGSRLGLCVPAPEVAIERLLSSGQISEKPPSVRRELGREVLVVRDPDGNELELSAG